VPPVRVIRLADTRTSRRGPVLLAGLMLAVGAVSSVLAIAAPARRPEATALLAIVAALALGIGAGMLGQLLRTRRNAAPEDIVRLLSGALDDAYLLLVSPRLPGVPAEVEALLVGPPGVRAVIARRWHGRYRVRGHGWEFDARGHRGWIPCITNPTFEGTAARNAVATWARGAGFENLPIELAVAFPDRHSRLVLEEPDTEVITTDNVPWWANGMGQVQRLNAERVIAFAESVIETSRRSGDGGPMPANHRSLTHRAG
jgi:hypothetical protein